MKIGIISDFNAGNFAALLEKACAPIQVRTTAAPFGQVHQTLLQQTGEFWEEPYDLLVIWTSPEAVVPRFRDVVESVPWSADDLERDVDAFADLLPALSDRARHVFVPSWVAAPASEHRPSLEMRRHGTATALMRMNLRLAGRLEQLPFVVPFNAERWLRAAGPGGFNDKLWYLSKTRYSKAVFQAAAGDMAATLRGVHGLRTKVVVLDLDNTLWGGVVGDVGWEALQLGGHDPVGEAYLEFQQALKRLTKEGVVLAIVSKNEEAVALEAIAQHPEMVLRSSDFAGWRINWDDKARNIADLLDDLNLGLDAAVFIDDSAHERSRVREALPDVLVPEWPSDPMDYARALRELRCFEYPGVSSEDSGRTAMYVLDRERKVLRDQLGPEQWLGHLDLEVVVETVSAANLARVVQLLNKTNQMNLQTRRMSAEELAAWAAEDRHRFWGFRVKDRIGNYGLCGLASVVLDGPRANVADFVLSCRAMGRGVEEAMMSVVAGKVREAGCGGLSVWDVATAKNRPCLRWIESQPVFIRTGDDPTFLIDVARGVPAPGHIRIADSSA